MWLSNQDKIPQLFILLLIIAWNLCQLSIWGQYIIAKLAYQFGELIDSYEFNLAAFNIIRIDPYMVRLLTTLKPHKLRTVRVKAAGNLYAINNISCYRFWNQQIHRSNLPPAPRQAMNHQERRQEYLTKLCIAICACMVIDWLLSIYSMD